MFPSPGVLIKALAKDGGVIEPRYSNKVVRWFQYYCCMHGGPERQADKANRQGYTKPSKD